MLKSWLREPLLHFLLIGAALFIVYDLQNDEIADESLNHIAITAGEVDRLSSRWHKKWQRAPTQEELNGLIEQEIREKVLYSEALALGLDRDDPVIRRRLAQKMEFISSDLAAQLEPNQTQLESYFAEHPQQFELPGQISFVQIYLNADRRGEQVMADARDLLKSLKQNQTPIDIATLGDSFMFEQTYKNQPDFAISRIFGSDFTSSIFTLPVGDWQGPIRSGVGLHLVRVNTRTAPRQPELEAVSDKVRNEWMAQQRRNMETALYQGLRQKYDITLPVGSIKP